MSDLLLFHEWFNKYLLINQKKVISGIRFCITLIFQIIYVQSDMISIIVVQKPIYWQLPPCAGTWWILRTGLVKMFAKHRERVVKTCQRRLRHVYNKFRQNNEFELNSKVLFLPVYSATITILPHFFNQLLISKNKQY